MAYQVKANTAKQRDARELRASIERLMRLEAPRYRRLWAYYRNPMRIVGIRPAESGSERPYRQAQEWGLPSRITGVRAGREVFHSEEAGVARKEVVIENDIQWRIDTMVDYLFGRAIVIRSAAPDPARRELIGRLLRAILAHNGGLQFLQQLALLGAVHGFVDVLVKLQPADACEADEQSPPVACGCDDLGAPPAACTDAPDPTQTDSSQPPAGPAWAETDPPAESADPSVASPPADAGAVTQPLEALVQRIARLVRLEIVEAARALPLLCPRDVRTMEAYVQCYNVPRAGAVDRPRTGDRESGQVIGEYTLELRNENAHGMIELL